VASLSGLSAVGAWRRLIGEPEKPPCQRAQRMADQHVACHEHGTALSGFLPASWDHLDCQLWDHPACRAGRSLVRSFDRRVVSEDVEVGSGGVQGGRRG
jgi:hypothetical protein